MKRHRLLVLLIVAPVILAAHAFGAMTVSEVGRGLLAPDQPFSFVLGGLLLIAVAAKLAHIVAFGAVGAGVMRLRERLTKKRRTAP